MLSSIQVPQVLYSAYIDNGGNDIVALHITDESDPTWKLGLKPYSTAFADAPTNGYVYGDIDSIGNVVDTDNFYIMNYTNGFFITHRGANLLYVAKSNGVSINNSSSIEVPLTINSALGQSSNLQEFKNSTGNTLLSVDKAGSLVFDTQIANVSAPNINPCFTAQIMTNWYLRTKMGLYMSCTNWCILC